MFADLRKWRDTTPSRGSGGSEMAKAISHALVCWGTLTLVLRNDRVRIDKAAERSMWPVTTVWMVRWPCPLGSWLHAIALGSP
jgi:hypothetical protein